MLVIITIERSFDFTFVMLERNVSLCFVLIVIDIHNRMWKSWFGMYGNCLACSIILGATLVYFIEWLKVKSADIFFLNTHNKILVIR